ncbi:hypothetical protein SO802_020514 [Lithocarpus litseifolius]|uniref:Uncharacterized protein n=1 Tax=Lithocarpus litseifolius TaxID=425828 RepID=A0AAW2CCR4_9ROSI
MTLGSSPTVARFLFSDFWWPDSVVVEWVSARVGGNLQRCCSVIPMCSSAAVRLVISLKVLILKAVYGLLNSFNPNATVNLAMRLKDSILNALDYLLNSDEALNFFEAFHGLLVFLASFPTALIGSHFQVLGVSPLDTHFAIILTCIVATSIHGIAYMQIKLQPRDAEYLPLLRFICLVSGIIAIELLVAILISAFWLFMVNLCPILILGVPRHLYQQIYTGLYYTADLVLNAVYSLFKKIRQLLVQIYDRVLQKFQ